MAVDHRRQPGKWSWRHAVGHFKTVGKHRRIVRQYCFAVGLYRQGLIHDLSKYSWTEFSAGVRFYQGNRSPNNAEREQTGMTKAWLHHKGRNKHHYEYWIDYDLKRRHDPPLCGMKMPKKYVVEMAMDRIAACRVYQGKAYNNGAPLEYYKKGVSFHLMAPETAALLEKLLTILADQGEEEMFEYVRKQVLSRKFDY